MAKVGRNEPCPCGSGVKFKRCHGAVPDRDGLVPPPPYGMPQEQLEAKIRRHKALEFQRERQQGRGRPIISAEIDGWRIVAVGPRLLRGRWLTFTDFLQHYVKVMLGWEWGTAEKAKPFDERHPFCQWLQVWLDLARAQPRTDSGMFSMPDFGVVRAFYGLAYDLYLIEHHAQTEGDRKALERLLARLRRPDQFFGALHEARAAGMLLRAGFDLTWEDEAEGRPGGHGEFVATFPQTGRTFWVECKMRQPAGDDGNLRYTHLVSAALQKQTDLERLVFVELNLPDAPMDPVAGGWPRRAVNQLRDLDVQPTAAALPPALILISNLPYHRHLDTVLESAGILLEGFRTARFHLGERLNLLYEIEARERDIEIESLWRSMQEHSTIPNTFDGSIVGLDESQRLLIGESYDLGDGEAGVLVDAIVVEQWRQIVAFFRLDDGRNVQGRLPVTDEQLEAWRHHPETFFGDLREHNPPAQNPLDHFDFFAKAYGGTSREKLLEFMDGHPDIDELRGLDQPELVKRYAYRLAASIAVRGKPPAPPAWYARLRRQRNPTPRT